MLNQDNQRTNIYHCALISTFQIIVLCNLVSCDFTFFLYSIDFFESAKQAWISAHPEFVPKVEQLPESADIPTPEQLPESTDIPTPEQLPAN